MRGATPRLARGMRPRLGPLDKLRRRLVAWYVGTTLAILLALGGALFVAVAYQIGVQLDQQLDDAVTVVAPTDCHSMARKRAASGSCRFRRWIFGRRR